MTIVRKRINPSAALAALRPASPQKVAFQSLMAAEVPDALLTLATVKALTGLGKTSLYARIAKGEFNPIRLGLRCTRFRAGDVQEWLKAQATHISQ